MATQLELHALSQTVTPTLRLLGDYWVMAIIATLKKATLRHGDLRRALPEANVVTLNNRLKKLAGAGFVVRHEYSRTDVRYRLSALGRQTIPYIEAFIQFSAAADTVRERHVASGIHAKHDARRRVGYRIY